ncbi:hypothetical protein ACWDOR_34060 [Streptosporangium canum]|uniref:hypothetical protein n=1 Tax=Streptosporangium TaxID=2000 RepID=UPI00332610D1
MAIEYLSDEQVGRYRQLAGQASPQELESFFRLDAAALERARVSQADSTALGVHQTVSKARESFGS